MKNKKSIDKFKSLDSETRREVLKKLWHDIVDDYEPGAEELAYRLDVSIYTLRDWYREDKPHRLIPLDKLVLALDITKDFRIIEFVLKLFNKSIFDQPNYCLKLADLHTQLAQSAKEYADFFQAGAESLTDGMLHPEEIERLEKEYSEASVKMVEALGTFKAFAQGQQGQKLKVVGE